MPLIVFFLTAGRRDWVLGESNAVCNADGTDIISNLFNVSRLDFCRALGSERDRGSAGSFPETATGNQA